MPTTVYNKREADKFKTGDLVDLVVVECTCGILFAIPENLHLSALAHRGPSGWQISCPLGHTWHFRGDDTETKLRKQLDAERDRRARATAELDQVKASLQVTRMNAARTRKDLKTLKQRVAHGVCPCCNRTFKQLEAHMKRQHPEYVAA